MSGYNAIDAESTTNKISQHNKKVVGDRRKNNIYGELSDYIVMSLLTKGIDGFIYNPCSDSTISAYARSENTMYVIKILYADRSEKKQTLADIGLTSEIMQKLALVGSTIGATPIVLVAKNHTKQIKLFNLANSKLNII